MAWTIDKALADPHITNVRKGDGEYEFRLGNLHPKITIRLHEKQGSKGLWWVQSHYIKTPAMLGPYHASHPWGDDEAYALHLAVTSLTRYYGEALKKGLTPSDDWLIPNENF